MCGFVVCAGVFLATSAQKIVIVDTIVTNVLAIDGPSVIVVD